MNSCKFSCARMPGQYKYINKELHTNTITLVDLLQSSDTCQHLESWNSLVTVKEQCAGLFLKWGFSIKHPDEKCGSPSVWALPKSYWTDSWRSCSQQVATGAEDETMNVLKARLGNPDIRNTSCTCWTCCPVKHPGLQCSRCMPALH